MKKYHINTRKVVDGRSIRFTSFVDEEGLAFEKALGTTIQAAATEQTLGDLQYSRREFYVFQMSDEAGKPVMQACIHVGRPRGFSNFAMATVPRLWHAVNGEEEERALPLLREFCAEIPGIMSLRLQPQRYDPRKLMDFQFYAIRHGYRVTNPMGIVRTRLLELEKSAEDLFWKLREGIRAKVRCRENKRVDIRTLTDPAYIEKCRQAEEASLERTGGGKSSFDFEAAFALANCRPDRVKILGLFFKDRPDELMAYVIGYRRGDLLEYSSAGSFPDPELRKISFNYLLVWELMNWGREGGCRRMDLGGVTDGNPGDPLRGVSQFKRAFPATELEVGREVTYVVRPLRFMMYRLLKRMDRFLEPLVNRLRARLSA